MQSRENANVVSVLLEGATSRYKWGHDELKGLFIMLLRVMQIVIFFKQSTLLLTVGAIRRRYFDWFLCKLYLRVFYITYVSEQNTGILIDYCNIVHHTRIILKIAKIILDKSKQ